MGINTQLSQADTWQSCVQALHAHIVQAKQSQCSLWINPAQTDVFVDNDSVQGRRVNVPITHPRFDVRFAPYLVALDLSTSADCDILEQSVQLAFAAWELPSLQAHAGQAIGGWIISDELPQVLANYWASRTHLHNVEKLTKLLRFHDPSVREWLWPALTQAQRAKLLGPARELIGINRQQRVMLQTQANVFNATDYTKLRLSSEQWSEIEDYAVVHAAWLAQASQELPQWVQTLSVNWQVTIFKALEKATLYGVTDELDRTLFAQHALQMGSDFHSHALLKDVWSKTREGSFYGGALEAVTGQPIAKLPTYLNSNTT
jgi:Domain of unknown function (DUF4123)